MILPAFQRADELCIYKLVLGYLSRVNTQSTTTSLNSFCFEDACYRRLDSVPRNWREAQQRCKNYGSTLPIISDPVQQQSFEAACRNLTSSHEKDMGIWIGARAVSNDPINWIWLDGSLYDGTGNHTANTI